jgi:hypothetical protein
MGLQVIGRLLLMLMCCTTLTWAAQDPAGTGDGGCRQIAAQLPHTASTVRHGLATTPRNAIRPSNLKWELPIAAATGLLIATSDDPINSHIQSRSFAQAASRGSNVGLGIELGAAGLMYLVGCSGRRLSYAANTGS